MRAAALLLLSLSLLACDDGASEALDAAGLDASEPDAGDEDASPDAALPDALPDAHLLDATLPPVGLRLNEAMAKNDGAWVDEVGEVEDWVELLNAGPDPIDLSGYTLADGPDPDDRAPLPARTLQVGQVLILFADKEPGELHLPFKISSEGETLRLYDPEGVEIDRLALGPSLPNESYARLPDADGVVTRCEWATPNRANGPECGPPPPPELPDDVTFAPYVWPTPWPAPPRPLILSELALRPASFIELQNPTDAAQDLSGWSLTLAPQAPGEPWPALGEGRALPLPASIPAGGRVVIPLEDADVAALNPATFEGVVSLWAPERTYPVDRVDFMAWPEGASLARPTPDARPVFCQSPTPGARNDDCEPVLSRPLAQGRLRHLRTPEDFATLAAGTVATGISSVKFVVDLEAGDTVHLLGTEAWDLHYTFVRELIEGEPHLDRCDSEQARAFNAGWYAFSEQNYFRAEGRRFLLGTLEHHGGADLWTVEFTPGDALTAGQARRAFFAVLAHVDFPERFFLRPQTPEHLARFASLEGQLPLVGPNAPFVGRTYQPLTETEGYGVLTFVPASALASAALGPEVLVVTDQVPNDIPLVGGLITEAFQTPLAHVNLLSRNRNTPNMALRDARAHPRVAPLLGKLVRLNVAGADFELTEAAPEEAAAFWAARRPEGPPKQPALDRSVRGVVALEDHGIEDLPAVGAKAAQLAELYRVPQPSSPLCEGAVLRLPSRIGAVALVHSLEHFQASGAAAKLAQLSQDPAFLGDSRVRAQGLAEVQALILAHPVDEALLAETRAFIDDAFGNVPVRLRSSSNTEDLPGFNGAGLYTSITVDPEESSPTLADGLRVVWASLYTPRGYDERTYHNVAQDGVAMAVLLQPAYPSERANGVAISRNILDPIYGSHYLSAQVGEALVTNPAPGVSTEELTFRFWGGQPDLNRVGASSLTPDGRVLTDDEARHISCVLGAIHDHFKPLIDPEDEDRWFAMDIEFKLLGPARELLIKQARPYSFGAKEPPADCREL